MSKELVVKQKYQIIDFKDHCRPSHWNMSGKMDKWRGKIVTIVRIVGVRVPIKEDAGTRKTHSKGWAWQRSDFEEIGDLRDPNIMFSINKRR